MSSAFDLFKSACVSKPFISFEDLPIGDYFIKSFAYIETKFGKKIRLDIGEKVVFLPERFVKRIGEDNVEKTLAEMNKGEYWLLYRGKNKAQRNQLMLDIESTKEYAGCSDSEY